MNILTFDIEDWFHINDSTWVAVENWEELPNRVVDNTQKILSLLAKHNQKATFFILGWIAEKYPELVRQIHQAGHEIGYHSYYHMRPFKQDEKVFESELVKGLNVLQQIIQQKVKYYRAPNFSLSNETVWMLPILAKHGIEVSSSVKSQKRLNGLQTQGKPFLIETGFGQIIEFPLNRISLAGFRWVYSGSGYFRILPYSLIRLLFSTNSYNMAYFHPNDLDANTPTDKRLPFYRNLMNTIGTKDALYKLEKLISSQQFICLGDAAEISLKLSSKMVLCKL